MSYLERLKLYNKVEECRNKPLICYVTSIRPGINATMEDNAVNSIIQQLQEIPKEFEEIDFLIVSNGGNPITAARIISILRERFKKISVLLPYVAYSAATLLALGADELLMHPYSNLGPVDAQLTVERDGCTLNFSSEDVKHFMKFLRENCEISDTVHLIPSLNALLNEVGPLSMGAAKRAEHLTNSLGKTMLSTHMADAAKVNVIAEGLNSSYYHHGYPLNKKEVERIGLSVSTVCKELEELLWEIWLDYESDMKCNEDFSLKNEIMLQPKIQEAMKKTNILNVPANIPQSLLEDFYKEYLSKIEFEEDDAIEINQLLVSIESSRLVKQMSMDFTINYWKDYTNNMQYTVNNYTNGWVTLHKKDLEEDKQNI